MKEIEIIASLHPFLQDKIKQLKEILDLDWRIYNGLRNFDEQTKLFAIGRTEFPAGVDTKTVTAAPPGYSYHNYGLACDWAFFKEGQNPWDAAPWSDLSNAVSTVGGLTWGGNFIGTKIDRPHVQLLIKNSIEQMLQAYKIGGLENAWKLVTINKGEN